MSVHTDAPDFARRLLPGEAGMTFRRLERVAPEERPLVEAFFGRHGCFRAHLPPGAPWRHLLVSAFAARSQYDRLVELARRGVEIPHGVACVARNGSAFHGFRGRSWAAGSGNVHLSVHLAPNRPVPRFESVFMALAAVSVVDALDAVPGLEGRARIKWVNDVLVGGAKVAGVLAHSQTRGRAVTSVVLGIGVNVETTPSVAPTAFVPAVASVRELVPGTATVTAPEVLENVLVALARNYALLLEGGYAPVVERYRTRSAVLGEEVVISSDDADEVPRPLAAGRVTAIGDGLELRLAGFPEPVTRGRLILADAAPELLSRSGTDRRRARPGGA